MVGRFTKWRRKWDQRVNGGRKKLLADPTVTKIVVEHKYPITRFGFRYIEILLAVQGRSIEVVNVTENPLEDIIAALVSITYSYCSKLYGQWRAKRKTEKPVLELSIQKEQENERTQEGDKYRAVS